MTRLLVLAIVLALVDCASASDVTATLDFKDSPDKSMSMKFVETVSSPQAKWRLEFANYRAHGNMPRRFAVRSCNSKQFGFCGLFSFFRVEANGIPDYKLQLGERACRPYEDSGRKGVEYMLNYDGAPVRTRFWMEPGSPFLEGEIRCSTKGVDLVRNLRVDIAAVPSFLDREQSGGWRFKGYRRAVKTAARTLRAGDGKDVSIHPDDRWFVLMDEDYDGSGEGKGNGPSAVLLRGACEGRIRLDDGWLTGVQLAPDPSKPFRFALAEFPSVRMSNGAFAEVIAKKDKGGAGR